MQSTSAEDTRTLVLGQVGSGRALVIGNLLFARLFHNLARVSSVGVARNDHILAVDSGFVRFAFDTIVTLETLLVKEILGLVFVKDLLLRLEIVAAGKIELATTPLHFKAVRDSGMTNS